MKQLPGARHSGGSVFSWLSQGTCALRRNGGALVQIPLLTKGAVLLSMKFPFQRIIYESPEYLVLDDRLS
jgi:hypothetical protein